MSRPATLDRTTPAASRTVEPRAYLMLALATTGFAINFWAWALLSPLGTRLKGELSLTSFQQAGRSAASPSAPSPTGTADG
jgi:NNP family nitrate/nitrite transporter-like MFS transporter